MASFFDGTNGMNNVKDLYNKMKKIVLILLGLNPKNFGNFGAPLTFLMVNERLNSCLIKLWSFWRKEGTGLSGTTDVRSTRG